VVVRNGSFFFFFQSKILFYPRNKFEKYHPGMRLAFVPVLVAVALGYYLYVAPLPFDAEVGPWEVQPNPERVGVLAPNTLLSKSSSLGQVGFTLRPAGSPSR